MVTKMPTLTYAVQIVPWASDIQYLGFLLSSELLCTRSLRTITNKATEFLCNSFPPTRSRLHTFTANQISPV